MRYDTVTSENIELPLISYNIVLRRSVILSFQFIEFQDLRTDVQNLIITAHNPGDLLYQVIGVLRELLN